MQYRKDRLGNDISILGYGCMRFTKKGIGSTDMEKTETELLRAIELGINYFDTAYIYPGSETSLGQILAKNNLRSKVKIATKLPQYLIRNSESIDKYFSEQLSRLQTDYIDYYLMHMLTDIDAWNTLKKIGIEEWISQKKSQGKIRQIGFSFHGDSEMFLKILKAYDWDFCQIQYNYIDEVTQAGVVGIKAATEKGIPVIIMEPLRGGKLVTIPNDAKTVLAQSPRKWTAPELALRWLWNQKEVSCVLSGMNSLEMIEENCRIASDVKVDEFTQEDFELTKKVKDIIQSKTKVGCTGCRYCMPCPKNVDIPSIFASYNSMYTESRVSALSDFIRVMGLRKDSAFADQCIGCGKCEQHCPQHIEIRKQLKIADKKLRPWYIKIGIFFMQKFFTPNRK
ncbi:MAG: aldo/keto reductase [Treponema sp.]|nr:aldo/keto reductase [Treponema sp.]